MRGYDAIHRLQITVLAVYSLLFCVAVAMFITIFFWRDIHKRNIDRAIAALTMRLSVILGG